MNVTGKNINSFVACPVAYRIRMHKTPSHAPRRALSCQGMPKERALVSKQKTISDFRGDDNKFGVGFTLKLSAGHVLSHIIISLVLWGQNKLGFLVFFFSIRFRRFSQSQTFLRSQPHGFGRALLSRNVSTYSPRGTQLQKSVFLPITVRIIDN